MQFPVTLRNEVRLVEASLATEADVAALEAWTRVPVPGDCMEVFDAAEYAGLACEKWHIKLNLDPRNL